MAKLEQAIKAESEEKRKRYDAAIDHAYRIAPNSEFVISCEQFLNKRGFLTDKQVTALFNVRPVRSYIWMDHDDIEEWGFPKW